MAKAYLVGLYREIKDIQALEAYAKIGGPAVIANGGKILARGGHVKSMEGGIEERTIIVEFESFEAAITHYNSDSYQDALKALGDGAVRDMRIVEGVE